MKVIELLEKNIYVFNSMCSFYILAVSVIFMLMCFHHPNFGVCDNIILQLKYCVIIN